MLTKEQNELVKYLSELNPIFGDNAFFYDKYSETNRFNGITDEAENWAYIELVENDSGDAFYFRVSDISSSGYVVTATYKLVARLHNAKNLSEIATVFANQLLAFQKAGITIELQDVGMNAEKIYRSETDETLRQLTNLVRVRFTISNVGFSNKGCLDSVCVETC